MRKRVAILVVVALTIASMALAQSSTGSSQPQQSGGTTTPPTTGSQQSGSSTQPTTSGDVETRPATTTVNGDTGLWFVPTGEILPAKKWSGSAYRANFDRNQGFTDGQVWPVTFGFGAADRAEIFGAWTLVRRVDRDVRPLFVSTEPVEGGVGNEHPVVREGWAGNQVGGLWVGARVSRASVLGARLVGQSAGGSLAGGEG